MNKQQLEAKILELEAKNKQLADAEEIKFNSLRDFVLSTTSKVEEFAPVGSPGHVFAARLVKGVGVVAACYLPKKKDNVPTNLEGQPVQPGEEGSQIIDDILDVQDDITNPGENKGTKIGDLDA